VKMRIAAAQRSGIGVGFGNSFPAMRICEPSRDFLTLLAIGSISCKLSCCSVTF
jgi:hypothetical protein